MIMFVVQMNHALRMRTVHGDFDFTTIYRGLSMIYGCKLYIVYPCYCFNI